MHKRKAQSIAEYAAILAIVGVALVAMQFYVKRGIQAVIKVSADQLGGQDAISTRTKHVTNQTDTTHVSASVSKQKTNFVGGSQWKKTGVTSKGTFVTQAETIEVE